MTQLGALTFLHRFGSSLDMHFHYHLVVLDGVFSTADDGEVQFHPASRLTTAHWHDLQRVVQRRVLRYFRNKGLLDEADASGMLTWRGSGGFSIDASVRIEGHDRDGVERLVRYCARPPVVSGILLHLNLHHLPPPLSPARGPPQGDFLLDQTSAFDLTEPEPVPDFAFDQSAPDDLDD